MDAITPARPRKLARVAAISASVLFAVPLAWAATAFGGDSEGPRAELVNLPARSVVPSTTIDSLAGHSRALRVAFLTREDVEQLPSLIKRFGSDVKLPGVRTLSLPQNKLEFAFVTLKPWVEKSGNYVNTYHVGRWPGERRNMPDNYDNPVGFIEVTPENLDLRLSTHFTLRSFLTHDQENVWPKYVVMREELLDKLELVLTVLEEQNIPTRNVVVLSGFRTPQYNRRASFEGAAYASRHQYGDAADVIIDADHDGRMDDLNRDGTVNFRDTDVINRAVEKVEQQYPELVGGLGLYRAMGPSGPFAHIDVRGTRARWSNTRPARAKAVNAIAAGDVSVATPTGTCKAPPEFAHLCKKR
ncbi:MAG TPA: D-Ala-D-Ala carboxypeptidase family metallohydrolase [Gemmatimonadaceae bacterium]